MNNRDTLADLERRSYRSYRARIESERRLRRVGLFWSAAQTALAVGLIAVSVLYLAYPERQSTLMLVYLISLSVLALAVSVTVGALDYTGRAREMFRNYRAIQALSVRVESARKSQLFITKRFVHRMHSEYDLLLDNSENHTSLDWAVFESKDQRASGKRGGQSDSADGRHDRSPKFGLRLALARTVPFLLPSGLVAVALFTGLSALFSVIA
ncbi:SLATT domain-containing protein [Curtobacterium sp. ME26]|uniref:SLATT domain-containing protein n=1 Tax=Curtobacterium sp. ME26 TaxID=2744254 RepID=UPI0015F4ED31